MQRNNTIDPKIDKQGPTNISFVNFIRNGAIKLLIIEPKLKKNTIDPARNKLAPRSSNNQTEDHKTIIPIDACWSIFIAPNRNVLKDGIENLGESSTMSNFLSKPQI